jgi:hypothetical protein
MKKKILDFTHEAYVQLVNFMLKCLHKICKVICLNGSYNPFLLSIGATDVQEQNKLAQSLKQAIIALPP